MARATWTEKRNKITSRLANELQDNVNDMQNMKISIQDYFAKLERILESNGWSATPLRQSEDSLAVGFAEWIRSNGIYEPVIEGWVDGNSDMDEPTILTTEKLFAEYNSRPELKVKK